MIGIEIRENIGLGDKIQFSSLPENFFMATGNRLVDVSRSWIFDYNPYVLRDVPGHELERTVHLWNFGPRRWTWPQPRTISTYLSNAEIWASMLNVRATVNRPRLYVYEDFPFSERKKILLQVHGKSHGALPSHTVEHVIKKYGGDNLYLIGSYVDVGLPYIQTDSIWELAKVISEARMVIGPDSGPSWIAACYPDIVTKIVRLKPSPDTLKDWTPLEVGNVHSHWDDRCRSIHNPTDKDIGFTWSYTRI